MKSIFQFFILAFLPLLLTHNIAVAQKTKSNSLSDKKFGERLFFSGGLGLTFGDVTYIDLSPQVGYRFTEKFGAGVGATYIYYSWRQYDYSTSIYGGSVFGRYQVFNQVVAYSEFQQLNVDSYISRNPDGSSGRVWVPIWMVGAGYTSPPGSGLGFQLMVLWDVIEDINSPYQNPIIRAGISVGL